jgi:hypothetical protein
MRADETTPDTRLADDPMGFNPATAAPLLQLTMGGIDPGRGGNTLTARLRYFDDEARRPGLPPDVGALVTRLTADEADVTLVNCNQVEPRALIVQGGAYGEHTITGVNTGGAETKVGGQRIAVRLAPGAGAKLTLKFKRHSNAPTLDLPWRRS